MRRLILKRRHFRNIFDVVSRCLFRYAAVAEDAAFSFFAGLFSFYCS